MWGVAKVTRGGRMKSNIGGEEPQNIKDEHVYYLEGG